MDSYVRVPKRLLQLPARFRRGISLGARSAENTIKNAVRDSILKRWHKTGESANSVTSEVTETSGNDFLIVARSGTAYDVFGEYGTGEQGAEGAPSFRPANWNYGKLKGMKPRMAFHLGATDALPEMLKDLGVAIKSQMEG